MSNGNKTVTVETLTKWIEDRKEGISVPTLWGRKNAKVNTNIFAARLAPHVKNVLRATLTARQAKEETVTVSTEVLYLLLDNWKQQVDATGKIKSAKTAQENNVAVEAEWHLVEAELSVK